MGSLLFPMATAAARSKTDPRTYVPPKQLRILIVFAATPLAVRVARVLQEAGHIVIGADTERFWLTSPARYSRAYASFYRLDSKNLEKSLCRLWVSLHNHVHMVIPFNSIPPSFFNTIRNCPDTTLLYNELFLNNYFFRRFLEGNIMDCLDCGFELPRQHRFHSIRRFCWILDKSASDIIWEVEPFIVGGVDSSPWDVYTAQENAAALHWVSQRAKRRICVSNMAREDMDELLRWITKFGISKEEEWIMTEVPRGTVIEAHCIVNASVIRFMTLTTPSDHGFSRSSAGDWDPEPSTHIHHARIKDFCVKMIEAYAHGDHRCRLIQDGFAFQRVRHQLLENSCDWKMIREGYSRQEDLKSNLATQFNITFVVQGTHDFPYPEIRIIPVSISYEPHESLALILAPLTPLQRGGAAKALTEIRNLPGVGCYQFVNIDYNRGLYSMRELLGAMWEMATKFQFLRPSYWIGLGIHVMAFLAFLLCFQEERWDWHDPLPFLVQLVVCDTLDLVVSRLERMWMS